MVVNTYSTHSLGLNTPYAVIFKGTDVSTGSVQKLEFDFGQTGLDSWTPTGENTSNWGQLSGRKWVYFSTNDGGVL